jgi:hypothetical protein
MRTPPPELPAPGPQPPAQPEIEPALPALPPAALPLAPPLLPPFPRQLTRRRPLPDAFAVRRTPLPESAPPYDDPASEPGPLAGQRGQPARPPRRRPPGQAPQPGQAAPGRGAGRVPGPLPGSGEWPSQFAQALAEALAGSRPAQQVRPWTTEQTRRRIRQLGPLLQAGQAPRVRRVLTSAPSCGVIEMTVIVGIGSRTQALAVRLERAGPESALLGRERQWLCTAIEAA